MSKTKRAPKTLIEAVQYFADEDVAHAFVANLRWKDGEQVCAKCGSVGQHYFLKTRRAYKCRDCRRQFTLKVGTIFEDSPLPFSKWLPALWMIANCKNGISSYELARALGVTQKTAWFMLHRIRLAMQTGTFEKTRGTFEADETFLGGKIRNMHRSKRQRLSASLGTRMILGTAGKTPVLGVLKRAEGQSSKIHAKVVSPTIKGKAMTEEIREVAEDGSTVYTDADGKFYYLSDRFIHDFVTHSREYVRGAVHSNGVENFWSLLKRTVKGTYVNIAPFHTSRYLDEQAFRFNEREDDDGGRFLKVLRAIIGKRLTYDALTGKNLARRPV